MSEWVAVRAPWRKERRNRIVEFIGYYTERVGVCPTVREIAEVVPCSVTTVGLDLSWLVWKGRLERFQHIRGWRVRDTGDMQSVQ